MEGRDDGKKGDDGKGGKRKRKRKRRWVPSFEGMTR